MRLRTCLAWLAALLVWGSAPAAAQTQTFATLDQRLKSGDVVLLTDLEGRTGKVKIISLTSSSMTINLGDTTEVVNEGRIRKLVRIDSKWDGVLIGLVAGAVPGSRVLRFSCAEFNTCGRGVVLGAVIFGAIGAGIGGAIDDKLTRTVYISPQKRATFTMTPIVSPRRQGATVSIRF